MSEDMTWLKSFIDERIAASHRETSAAPNTAHGAVVVDRFGHVVSGMAGASGGGSDPLLAKYGITTGGGFTLTSGNTKRVNFNYQYDDFGSYVTTGASWKFTAPANGYYTWTPKLYLEIAGDPTGGNAVWIYHVNVTTAITTIIWQYNAVDFPAAAVNRFIGFPYTDYCDANDEVYIKLENGLGVDIVISGSSSARKINQVTIEKVKAI